MALPSRDDMLFAANALGARYVSQFQVHRAVRCLEEYEKRGALRTMAGVMVAKGFLAAARAEELLHAMGRRLQKCTRCRAGRYVDAAEPGVVSECDCCRAAAPAAATDAEGRVVPRTLEVPVPDLVEPEPESDPLIGREIAPFRILRKLGEGGMGCVYYAENMPTRRVVAIKILPVEDASEDERVIRRFLREGKAASRLKHPNIVKIYDAGRLPEFYYIEMEYIRGRTVSEYIDCLEYLLPAEAVMIAAAVLRGLAVAHAAGMIHRDIKPDNIMVTSYGRVKLADFGVVKDITESVQLTHTGCVMGTPWYMAPEQCMGQDIDARADLYAVGITLFHMLTGRRPFDATNALAVMQMQRQEPLPDPRTLRPDVPAPLAVIVQKLAAKKPEHRFANAEEALRQLRRLWRSGAVPPAPLVSMLERYAEAEHPAEPAPLPPTEPNPAADTGE